MTQMTPINEYCDPKTFFWHATTLINDVKMYLEFDVG